MALRIRRILAALVAAWSLASLVAPAHAQPASPRFSIVPMLQDRLGLTDVQVRGASQVAPAVMQALSETGHSRERDILARVIG